MTSAPHGPVARLRSGREPPMSADRLAELEDFAKQAGVALRDAWLVLNELAIVRDLASPAESESVLRSEKFDSAAYRVRTALSRHALMKGRT